MALPLRQVWKNTTQCLIGRFRGSLTLSRKFCINANKNDVDKIAQSKVPEDIKITDKKVAEERGGFARAFEKYTAKETPPPEEEESFCTLLRNSKFIDLGDPEGKLVEGTIYHIVDDDLYIDFGWKFPCVCSRPTRNGSYYVRGAKVLLRLKELELSTRFLGAERDLTLLEADATLTALLYSPARDNK
ncbi:small ribosomal subunit protein bS1m [Hetaerina americana]|uniref:small ribosomal subunit protein bS1m n=1 Tax=Hetaerina americana TaxID=62018 RepID=UPI003A7F3CD8